MDTLATTSYSWLTDNQLLVPIIASIIAVLLTNFLTYYFNKKIRLEAEWRVDKLKHYEELIASITLLMSMPENTGLAYKEFQRIANVMALVAPQKVVNLLMEYQEETRNLDQVEKEAERAKIVKVRQLMRDLVLAIRKDLKISPKDVPENFRFYLKSPELFDD